MINNIKSKFMKLNNYNFKKMSTVTQKLGINPMAFYKFTTFLLAIILMFFLILFGFILYYFGLEQERLVNTLIEYSNKIDDLSQQISSLKKNISSNAELETSASSNISKEKDTEFYDNIGVGLTAFLLTCLAYYISTKSGLDISGSSSDDALYEKTMNAFNDNSKVHRYLIETLKNFKR